MRTSKRGVFAGGDIVAGGATVSLAMGAGRKAAKAGCPTHGGGPSFALSWQGWETANLDHPYPIPPVQLSTEIHVPARAIFVDVCTHMCLQLGLNDDGKRT